jgi:hypothetical protein
MQSRLEELEKDAQQIRKRTANEVIQAALAALSGEDLSALKQFFQRLSRGSASDEAIANCTPAETAAISLDVKGPRKKSLRTHS